MPQYELGDLDSRLLNLLDENNLFYPQARRYYNINEALQVTNLASPFVTGTLEIPGFSVAGQSFYGTPAGMIFPLRVYFNAKALSKVSFRSLTMRYRNWAIETASMGQPVQEWVPLGMGMFLIHPTDNQGGQTISVNGVLEPPYLNSATDTITIEDEWITTIVNLAFCSIVLQESSAEFASLSMVYQGVIRDLKSRIDWGSVVFGKYYLLEGRRAAEVEAT